jgi:hypothetical protein
MMAWRSDTFAVPTKVAKGDAQKIDQAADRHRAAMTKVVKAAKALAHDRRTTLDQIKDPQLKRSASR